MIRLLALGAVLLCFTGSAAAHRHSSPAERYFANRCSQTNTVACLHRASLHWEIPFRSIKYIAYRESRFDPYAKNPQSTAAGLLQFLASTWAGSWNPYNGHSVFRAKWNALAGAYAMHLGYWSWWACC